MARLILASASPRRAELLRAAGIEFDVLPSHIDETPRAGEPSDDYVRRIAEAKARATAARAPGRLILAADTTVVVDGQMLGKPLDDEDATRMLRLLSGRVHAVLTAVSVSPESAPATIITELARTEVEFAPLRADDIRWYVATGEPHDKAGAYAIQGYASRFVTRIEGSYSNVVGLPIERVYEILKGLMTL